VSEKRHTIEDLIVASLRYIDQGRTIAEIAEIHGFSETDVDRALAPLLTVRRVVSQKRDDGVCMYRLV